MKTILYSIETSGPGGAEKMLISLVDSLDRSRFRAVICLLKKGWLHDQLLARGHLTYVNPLHSTVDVRWVRRAMSLLKSERVDVMHAHEFYMNAYSALLAKLTGIPSVTTIHGKNYSSAKWYRRAAYRAVSRTTKMIAVSTGIADFLSRDVGIDASRLTTVRNGIDASVFAPTPQGKANARADLGLSMQQPVIGCLGNLYPVKGHTHLIEAAAAICRRYCDAVFLFAGRGHMLETLQQQAAQLGIERNMRFLGFREDTPALLAAMDVFVLPSLSEGLPLSLLEAMAAEKGIVASEVGGIPEVIVSGQNGFLVRPADPPGLAEKILALLDAPDRASAMAQRARTDVLANFDIAAMTRTYEEMYESLAASR